MDSVLLEITGGGQKEYEMIQMASNGISGINIQPSLATYGRELVVFQSVYAS